MYERLISMLGFVCLLAGCGGGGSDVDPPPPPPPPPEPGAMIALGPVPASGDFTISDVAIDTGRAQVFFNGEPGTLQDLEAGHVVGVVASTDASGRTVADEIHFMANVTGPVDSVDAAAGTLVVMGQPVSVNARSVLSTPLERFTRGEVIRVSGFTDSSVSTKQR